MVKEYIQKCVTIPDEQETFLKLDAQKNFKLSKFLQEKLWEYMKKIENRNLLVEDLNRNIRKEGLDG